MKILYIMKKMLFWGLADLLLAACGSKEVKEDHEYEYEYEHEDCCSPNVSSDDYDDFI